MWAAKLEDKKDRTQHVTYLFYIGYALDYIYATIYNI